MKPNFKYIVISIIASLSIVFLIQLFWLKGLYNSIEIETEKNIFDCLNIANSHELEFRMDSLENSSDKEKPKGEISITQSIGNNDSTETDTSESKKTVKSKRIVQHGDTIQDSKEEVGDEEFSLIQFEKLGILIRETMHQTIDSIAPIRLDTLHSALLAALNVRDIKSDIYKIEVVDFSKDSVIQSLDITEIENDSFVFNYTFDSNNQLGYRVHFEALTKTILSQMFGILSTTALIVLILAFAFWYLIRTIFQQKTLDEMKDDFTNNMTHELKTPIAVAYSATDALLNFGQVDNKERREKYLSINKEQLEKLSSLVEQILSMSVERRLKLILKKEDIRLKYMLETLIEQHRMKSEREIIFNLNIQPDDLTICADKTHLNNALSNLMDNAIKYSKDKTIIDITAYIDNMYFIIKVKDNGIGIAPDKQKFVFEKFYRVPQGNKHNAKGYGIGLFYVKTIVEKHGGIISVHSAIGKGSEFTIKIPVE
jgi:signal transduction histidine kinase